MNKRRTTLARSYWRILAVLATASSRASLLLAQSSASVGKPLVSATGISTNATCWPASSSGWLTIANNGQIMPDSAALFNSYNPSVNSRGAVIFRARSKGQSGGSGGQPIHGIYVACGSLVRIADRNTLVPDPNNLGAQFIEFPAFPRIAPSENVAVFRGNSQPAYQYGMPGEEIRIGTTGLFLANGADPLKTSVNQLGPVPGFEYFAVPGASSGNIKFDVFPGAPSTDGSYVVFKGNYTDNNLAKTAIYYRDATPRRTPNVEMIANTDVYIPGTSIRFGSTAPPSAAKGTMVFVGLDNEDAPTFGGIYLAPIKPSPSLTTLVRFGEAVPGFPGETLNQLGEGLSYDGRYVAFWGAWGSGTRSETLICPSDGEKARIAYCLQQYPNGFAVQVPVNQGIFVYDTNTKKLLLTAKTGQDNFHSFQYWNFSGNTPGTTDEDEGEPARWRSSAFVAVSTSRGSFDIAFKATKGDGTQGIYLSTGPNPSLTSHTTILDTTMTGQSVDPRAPAGVTVTTLAIERDGYRAPWFTLTASMASPDATVTWGGVYLMKLTR